MNAATIVRAPAPAAWDAIPLEVLMSVGAVILAGGLTWAGLL